MKTQNPTAFQRRVYDAVSLVPRGKVTTYREVAQKIACGSPRAVGQALRVNPYAPRVPCHRVIASDLTLGGFRGRRGGLSLTEKRRLLRQEGVRFSEGRLADPEQIWRFS